MRFLKCFRVELMRWFGVLFSGSRMPLGYCIYLADFIMHAEYQLLAMILAVNAVCSRVCLPPAPRSKAISLFPGISCAILTTAKLA